MRVLNKINTFYHNWSYANQTRVIKPLQAIAANILDENSNHFALSAAMRAKIREVDFTAKKNIRMLLITDSGLIQADTCLDRMKELTIKAMSNILTDEDRLVIQREIESVRAEMEHNAYQTNDKIREMIGLPQIRGHFSQIQNPNRAASDSIDQQESFKNGEFIYDPSSDQEFADYIENLKQQAKQNRTPKRQIPWMKYGMLWNSCGQLTWA